ncbi:GrpB family protein [Microbacterium sp. H83]|uniref:GrpB family protein n=1 Tax=Microbacterium sp. H83 TaxID=1827324 RepID=UPI0007F4269A|nr:GrpB family protein [Microbacterium sp. H83]OAN33963.1 hypothetical protein A4X16_05760 [Microbacterium sp. H83]
MARMLVPYDPSWADRFEHLRVDLAAHGDPDWVIEHIGSTAVPGMRAKPIIDIAVRVVDRDEVERHRPGLESIGWRLGSSVRTHPVMLLETGGTRTAIAHFFMAEEWEHVNQRILRDWLRTHPEDVVLYDTAKIDAVAAASRGSSYSAAKTPVIQEIVDRARAQRGLPAVPVPDKHPS